MPFANKVITFQESSLDQSPLKLPVRHEGEPASLVTPVRLRSVDNPNLGEIKLCEKEPTSFSPFPNLFVRGKRLQRRR
jgi:hypothetical protein